MYTCARIYIYAYIPYMYTHDVYINILYRYSYGICRHTIWSMQAYNTCAVQRAAELMTFKLNTYTQIWIVAATICCSHDAPFHLHKHLHTYTYVCEAGGCSHYGVAHMSRNDITIVLYCKRDLQKRRYSAKETYNLIDPTDRSHPIDDAGVSRLFKIIGLFLQKSHIKETIF